MIYNKNNNLDINLFKNPTSKYRSAPFWAWNTRLEKEELLWQIEEFKKMGFGGFHMHSRSGLDTEYLSDEFMDMVKTCVNKAKKEDMFAYLYDEDRWPSGFAGGLVTKNRKFAQRYLKFTITSEESFSYDVALNEGKTYLLAIFDIILDDEGFLTSYKIIKDTEKAQGIKWYAYICTAKPSGWYNNQAYVDVLSKEAIDKFIETTYEKYKEELGDDFGKTSPSIFTDEPSTQIKVLPNNSLDRNDIVLGWTMGFDEDFERIFGYSLTEKIPELIWHTGKPSVAKYHYHRYLSDRFANCYFDNIGSWCENNGIKMTGHLNSEEDLEVQMAVTDDCMRMYKNMHIPGIDILSARLELTTAKQAHSVVNQYGKEGMCSELYGVCDWDYDFRGYKLHGDWQACLGVTIRVPHLSWYAMGGEAKRDYPASIHYQSPWWQEFSYLEDHFARVNAAMTRGNPIVKVGVIHPVESFWLHWGPNDKTALMRENMDKKFFDVTDWLVKGSIDFNFISESLLPSLCENAGAPLKVGEMEYDAIVVPECETLRSTTLERLEKFRAAGGKLIFMGSAPIYENGAPSERGKELYGKSTVISYDKAKLLTALDDNRTVTLRLANGNLSEKFIYQLRKDGNSRWLFISRCSEPYNKDVVDENRLRISVKGEFTPYVYDTVSGDISKIACEYKNGCTVISKTLYDYDSLLLKLDEGKSDLIGNSFDGKDLMEAVVSPALVPYTLSERNALLLDIAEFAVDGGEFKPAEEILRLDNVCREILGFKERGGHVAQPWCSKKKLSGIPLLSDSQSTALLITQAQSLLLKMLKRPKSSSTAKMLPTQLRAGMLTRISKPLQCPKSGRAKTFLKSPFPSAKQQTPNGAIFSAISA